MEAAQENQNPFALAPDGKKKLFLVGLLLCVFGSIMQSTTLSIMLPMSVRDVGGQDIYSLASTLGAPIGIVGMPLYGYLAARQPSIKIPLMVVSYIVGCVVLVLRFIAWDMWIVILAMVFWGMVSPATFVLGYSLIRDMFDAKKAGAYLGMCGTAMMLASLIGPIGGGALMGIVGWRAFNLVILPFMLVGALCIAFSVKVTKEQMAPFARGGSSFDLLGTVQIFHQNAVEIIRDAEAVQQRFGIRLRFPPVHLGKLGLQLRRADAVVVREVFLRVNGVLFLHDLIQPLVAADHRVEDDLFVIFEVILFQKGQALAGRDLDGTVRRVELSRKDL